MLCAKECCEHINTERGALIVTHTRCGGPRHTSPVGKDVRFVSCGLLVVTFMATTAQAVVATAGPTVAGEPGGLDGYARVFVAYTLAFGAVMPVYGKVGYLLGRGPVLVFALVTFLLDSAACGLAGSMGELIAFRLVQGLGGGGPAVLAMAIVGELLGPRQRARCQGVFTVVFATASGDTRRPEHGAPGRLRRRHLRRRLLPERRGPLRERALRGDPHRAPRRRAAGAKPLHHGASAELSPARLAELPQQALDGLAPAYADALSTVFLCAAPVLAPGFGAALLMRNLPLHRATGERQRGPDAEE